jgi:urate oxidase
MSESRVEMVANRYGKSRVRLLKVTHGADGRNEVFEWNVQVLLTGEFETAHTVGDNSQIVATDTMKNIVYSLARKSKATAMEDFSVELVEHFMGKPQVSGVRVQMEAALWKRVTVEGKEHPDTFMRGSNEVQTSTVEAVRGGETTYAGGFKDLNLLKTANSEFWGFERDELTTLPETKDRVFGTAVEANWTYTGGGLDFKAVRTRARETMLRVFANHVSESVQHTLFAMAEETLGAVGEITELWMAMPNKHCLLIDLARFGQDNPNEIFVPTDEPHGYIEARVRRR